MSCNKNLIISTTLTTLTNGTISLQGCNLSITSLSTTTPPKAGGSTYIYGEKDVTIAGYGDNPKITLSNTTGANGVMTIKGNVLNLDTTYIYQNNTPLNDIYARLTGANTFTQNNTFASKVVLSGSSGTKGIQFGSANYQITNIEAGSIILSLPKSVGGERPNAQITLKQPNFGSGTWHFYVGILGDESETVSFATNALSSTGFKISIRRQVDISSRTDLPTNVPYTLHWLAVKYY